MSEPETVHASAVRLGEYGVLIRGASGSGKSALVLGLLAAEPATARLIADDRVILAAEGRRLVASVPETIAGLLEIRGQGIVRRPHDSPAALHLLVELRPLAECPRLPARDDETAAILGLVLPRLILPIGAVDGPLRVRIALDRLVAARD
jgi:serine kinase of HPr protein (carbohydrate metabolism regulator)